MADDLALGGGERLPWLETAEEYDARQRRSWTVVLMVLGGLAVLLLVIGGIYWTQRDRLNQGNGELIAAPEGPYKVRAAGDDGSAPSTDSDAMLAASEGQEALGRVRAAAVTGTADAAVPVPNAAAPDVPVPAVAVAAEQPARVTGSAVQLGAFDSAAIAEAKWRELSGAQAGLRPLTHSVEPVQSGGKTVHRLRVAVRDAEAATSLCRSLQRGNLPCFVVR